MGGQEIVEVTKTEDLGDGVKKKPDVEPLKPLIGIPTDAIPNWKERVKVDAMRATGLLVDARISGHQSC